MMRGIAYGVGVGPGDPELMTLKAVRLIRESEVIALPGAEPGKTLAYRIAVAAVPELAHRELVPVCMPMVKDRARIDPEHRRAAKRIEGYLDQGRDVVFLTLGDPTVYSTFTYIRRCLEADGYETAMVPGVTSFCAAAARLNVPLCAWDEPLHILPVAQAPDGTLDAPGTCVLMKSGGHLAEVKQRLRDSGRDAMMVENCTLPGERICRGVDGMPDDAGYFTLIIAREGRGFADHTEGDAMR